ncbi:MAG: DUF4153 domain-containing protein, partial [candidate division Zixibacteria bacterium]|nr:DUF4153 domain-containing protein [candidate division Zixibacteria bacterium]
YRLMVPLVIMLFLAIRRRIIDYGVTEPRYVVVSLAVGLSIVVLYFMLSRRKDIRVVPITLFCLAIVGAYGPLSASSISTWSQTSRLESLLIENGLLKDGVIQKPETELSLDARRSMSSVIAYLNDSRGPEVFAKWLPDSALKVAVANYPAKEGSYAVNDTIARLFGFEYNWSPYFGPEGNFVSMWVEEPSYLDVAGYDKMLSCNFTSGDKADSAETFSLENFTCRASLLPKSSVALISFVVPGDTTNWELRVDLAERIEQLRGVYNPRSIPQDSLRFDRSVGAFDTRLFVRSLYGEKHDGKLELTSLRAQILVRKKS